MVMRTWWSSRWAFLLTAFQDEFQVLFLLAGNRKKAFFPYPPEKVSNVYWFLCFCVSRFSSSSEQWVVERDGFIILFYFRPSGLCFLLDCGFAWCIERFADFHLSRINCVANSWGNSHIQGDWCECFVRVFDDMITTSQVNFGNWSSNQAAVLVRLQQLMSFTSVALFPKFCGSYIRVPFVCRRERRVFFPEEYESLALHVQCSKQVLATKAIILFCSRNWEHPGLRLLYVVHCSLSLGRGLSAV